MVRSTRNRNNKTSGHSATKKASKDAGGEASLTMKPRDIKINDEKSPTDSSDKEEKPTDIVILKRDKNGRPPLLPRRKVTKTTTKKEEATGLNSDTSPLKKKLLGNASAAIAIVASTSGRPLRRAAAAKKKQYAEVDSATDGETSSSDESDYAITTKSKEGSPTIRKATKRKKGSPSCSKASNAKKARMKTPSPKTKLRTDNSPGTKKLKASPRTMSTPRDASIGLTPIKDSIKKVWKNSGGDWRVSGAIDYGFD